MATKKPVNKLKKKSEMKTVTLSTEKQVSKPTKKKEPGIFKRLGLFLIGQDPPTKRKRAAKKAAATRRKRSG